MFDYANLAARSQETAARGRIRISGAPSAGHGALVAFGLPVSTRIASSRGLVPLGNLGPGDDLHGPDGRMETIAAAVDAPVPAGAEAVLIRANALGPGCPASDMVLPMGQGVRLASPLLTAICGVPEAFAAAEDLTCLPGITLTTLAPEPRRHLILDRAGVLAVDGLALCPFVPTGEALQALGSAARDMLFRDLPRLRYQGVAETLDTGLPWLEPSEVQDLVAADPAFAAASGGDTPDPAEGHLPRLAAPQGAEPIMGPFPNRAQNS